MATVQYDVSDANYVSGAVKPEDVTVTDPGASISTNKVRVIIDDSLTEVEAFMALEQIKIRMMTDQIHQTSI